MLCMPLRAGSKAIIRFAYTDVGKEPKQDAVALLVNLERPRHCSALTAAHLIALEPAEKILGLIAFPNSLLCTCSSEP